MQYTFYVILCYFYLIDFFFSVCGESEVLEILVNSGGDPNTPDIHQAYPIHYAAQMCGPNSEMGNETKVGLQVLRKLISLGVDVNVTDHEDRQPLTWAAGSGSSDAILRYLRQYSIMSCQFFEKNAISCSYFAYLLIMYID